LEDAELSANSGGRVSWGDPSWKQATAEYRRSLGDRVSVVNYGPADLAGLRNILRPDVSIDKTWRRINHWSAHPTPQTTIEAILYDVRTFGIAALNKPANVERLSRCDEAAKAQINSKSKSWG
jgi:hypothetical protein